MELRQLEYFLAVAETGHFTRAAQEMHVSQPALSQQIKKLETELGTPLFDRLGRGVELTDAGRLLRPRAEQVLAELSDARTAVNELQGLKRGAIRVGTVQTTGEYLIPNAVARFHASHPEVHVSVEERSAPGIEDGLTTGALDLGIGFVTDDQGDLSVETLFDERLVAIIQQGYPLADAPQQPVSALADHPLILLPEGFCTRRLIDQAFQAAEMHPLIRLEMNSIAGILQTVRTTRGVTILPALTLSMTGTEGLQAVALTNPAPRREVGLLFHKDRHRSAAAQAFAEHVRFVAKARNASYERLGASSSDVAGPET